MSRVEESIQPHRGEQLRGTAGIEFNAILKIRLWHRIAFGGRPCPPQSQGDVPQTYFMEFLTEAGTETAVQDLNDMRSDHMHNRTINFKTRSSLVPGSVNIVNSSEMHTQLFR